MRKRNLSLIVFIILVFACKQNQRNAERHAWEPKSGEQQNDELIREIEKKIDSSMKINDIPALSIGIVQGGKLRYAKGFGVYERGRTEKVDENSIYQIASDTKKFTAIIARNLISEGKLTLDESIVPHLPNSVTTAAKEKLRKITVKDLLLHTSGIPNRAPSNKRIDGDPMLIAYTEQDLIYDLNHLELDFEPGTEFDYSNFGYAVMGFICELSSGQDYSTLLKKYITHKFGMENTFIFPNDKQLLLIVTPYRKDDRTVKTTPFKMGKITPAGGIYSNVTDLSKLMIAQIRAYREFNEGDKEDNMLILTESDGMEGSHYGFGLAKIIDSTGTRYGHGGDLDGYASGYLFSPQYNRGLIMLTSSGGSWFGQLEKEIRIKFFKENVEL
jgi:CubicO group peptidase (beta-lactamase class C family)